MKKVVIVGATSGIGKELTKLYEQEGCIVGVVGRRENLLKEICSRNSSRNFYRVCDITRTEATTEALSSLINEMGGMDVLILCSGVGEPNPELDYSLEEPTVLTNVVGFTNSADWGFRYFEQQRSGHLVTITSVGGIRGSGISPAYNASKSYQINYMEGLRQKAAKLDFPVYTTDIRPGFVDTAMAKGEGIFWIVPAPKAALQMYKAISRRRKTVYVSKRWKYVAFLLRLIPSFIYQKM